jgi:hypothetical protein
MATAEGVKDVSEVIETVAEIGGPFIPGLGGVVTRGVVLATDAVQRAPGDIAEAINDASDLLSLHKENADGIARNTDRIAKAEELLADIASFLHHAFPTMFKRVP